MEKRKEEMDPLMPPPAFRQPSMENVFLEHCDATESLNMEKLLTNPWSTEETNTCAATFTVPDPNPTTLIHRQGSPTLSLPRRLHRNIVDKVWAKIQKEQLPLTMNVGEGQRVHDLDAPPLSLSPSPYEIAPFPMEGEGSTLGGMTSVACGDDQSLWESGGRMEMSDLAVQQGTSTAGIEPRNEEGIEGEGGARGKKSVIETEEKEIERRMKKLIRSRESAARFHAKKQAYRRELEAKVNQLREENARLREEEQKNWARMTHLIHESIDHEQARNNGQKTVCMPRRRNSSPW